MCWICDHPEATRDDYLSHLRGLIGKFGWAVQGVERDRIHPPWAYTAGLTAYRRPELVITGMPVRRAGRLLNDIAAHVLHAEPPRPGEQVRLTGGPRDYRPQPGLGIRENAASLGSQIVMATPPFLWPSPTYK